MDFYLDTREAAEAAIAEAVDDAVVSQYHQLEDAMDMAEEELGDFEDVQRAGETAFRMASGFVMCRIFAHQDLRTMRDILISFGVELDPSKKYALDPMSRRFSKIIADYQISSGDTQEETIECFTKLYNGILLDERILNKITPQEFEENNMAIHLYNNITNEIERTFIETLDENDLENSLNFDEEDSPDFTDPADYQEKLSAVGDRIILDFDKVSSPFDIAPAMGEIEQFFNDHVIKRFDTYLKDSTGISSRERGKIIDVLVAFLAITTVGMVSDPKFSEMSEDVINDKGPNSWPLKISCISSGLIHTIKEIEKSPRITFGQYLVSLGGLMNVTGGMLDKNWNHDKTNKVFFESTEKLLSSGSDITGVFDKLTDSMFDRLAVAIAERCDIDLDER